MIFQFQGSAVDHLSNPMVQSMDVALVNVVPTCTVKSWQQELSITMTEQHRLPLGM